MSQCVAANHTALLQVSSIKVLKPQRVCQSSAVRAAEAMHLISPRWVWRRVPKCHASGWKRMNRGSYRATETVIGHALSPHNQLQHWLVIVSARSLWLLQHNRRFTLESVGSGCAISYTCAALKSRTYLHFCAAFGPQIYWLSTPMRLLCKLHSSFCSTAVLGEAAQSVAMP